MNALASALDYGARLIVGFLITPLLVTGLGNYFYGVWRVLDRLVGYISPASGRATQALKWTLASKQASSNYDEKRVYVGSTLAVWGLFSPFLTVVGGFLSWFTPYLLGTPKEFFWSVRLTAGLLVANLILTSLVQIPMSVLEGENLGYKRMGLSAALVFIGGGFTWLALYYDTGIIGVTAATLATTLLTGIFFWKIVHTYAPWFGVAKPSSQAVRKFLGLSGWFLLWHLIMRLMIASDVVLLGLLDSVELVTTYSLSKYAPETLIALVAILVFGITPGLGGIIGSGNLHKATLVRNEMMSLTWLMFTVLGFTILLWNWAFIRLWVGAEHYAGSIPTVLIMVTVTQFVLIRNDSNIIDLTLRLRRKVIIGALSVSLSLFAAGVLVRYFNLGISGLCLGLIFGRSILSIGYPLMVSHFLKVSFFAQLKGILRPVSVTTLFFLIASKLSDLLVASYWFPKIGWIDLILSIGVTFCVATLLAFYSGLPCDQRRFILRRFRNLVTVAPE